MRTVTDLLEVFEKQNLQEIILSSIRNTAGDFVRIQQEQLKKGLRSDGNEIFRISTGSDEYSPGYAKKKGFSKPIDLYNLGNFYGGINVSVDELQIQIESDDIKNAMLQEDYGKEILGLNSDSKAEYREILTSEIIRQIKEAIGL